jgi:hypothetical protein
MIHLRTVGSLGQGWMSQGMDFSLWKTVENNAERAGVVPHKH